MNPTTDQQSMPSYASDAVYISEPLNMRTGHSPLDTLPAAWWNWLWHEIIQNNNGSYLSLGNVRDEIISVLQNAPNPITPSQSSTTQLYQAIVQLTKVLATATVAGAVKSAAGIKQVSVDANGAMNVNALNDWTGTDTIKTVIGTAVTAEELARKNRDVQSIDTSISGNTLTTTVTSSDGTTHSDTSATVSSHTLGLSGSTLTSKVNNVSGTVDLSSIVSGETTERKSRDVQSIDTMIDGNRLSVAINSTDGSIHTDNTIVVTSVAATLSGSELTIAVNGETSTVDLSSLLVERATYARYLVNSTTSTSTLVTADTTGNLRAHTLTLS